MKKRFYYGAMAAGLLFAACSSDNLSEPTTDNGPAEADKTIYVKMAIHGDIADGTRAASVNGSPEAEGDFDKGTDESYVNNAYFVFYDANDNQVGNIVSVSLGDEKEGVNGTTVEKYYEDVVSVSIKKGELDPAKVICYINPISPNSLQSNLKEIQTVTRKEVSYTVNLAAVGNEGDANYKPAKEQMCFPMSNSVYYDGTSATVPEIAVSVSGKLYDSEEEALKEGNEAVDIYVERYASKLKFSSSNVTPYVTATADLGGVEKAVELTFVPERWALNAETKETYAVKSFRQASNAGTILADNYSYSLLNERINASSFKYDGTTLELGATLDTDNSWKWNNETYHRSFWAVSPAYFTSKYPEVASDVDDATSLQKYFSYDDLKGTKPAGFAANDETAKYFRETTVGIPALASGNPAAAMPSVILVGKYTLKVDNTPVAGNPDFYTYLKGANGNPLVFFDNNTNSADSKVAGGVSMLKRFLEQTTILFKKDAKGNYVRFDLNNTEDLNTLVSALEVAKPAADVLKYDGTAENGEDLKVAARQRTLQIKKGATTTGIYVANGNGYKEIVADNTTAENFNSDSQIKFTAANRALMQQVGFANKYESGAGYFNIPVKHYGWYRKGNQNRTNGVDNPAIDWSKVMVGDFGMVRNHSYSIEVNSIKGLATGIGGSSDPIVPPADTKDYYVAYKVRILKWAVVPQQNVDL